MKILFLSFFFEPDLSAGSFRNTALADALQHKLSDDDSIDVITTLPNRYHTYKTHTNSEERKGNIHIRRVSLTVHKNGFLDQILSFQIYFRKVLKMVRNEKYDIVYASSSKLFTAFLGAVISRIKGIPLYLDLRDIFVDTINDVIKNKLFKVLILPLLGRVELFTYKSASHINLVSEGFREYFEEMYDGPITYYSNGIDDEFIHVRESINKNINSSKIITYAGNIGEGQGLEKIIPEAALALGDTYRFRIIGDGGRKPRLKERIEKLGVRNVELIPPVSRKDLLKYYMDSDYLFLHLNNYKAFEKVLPSKIFEYGAIRKRIIAGVSGYSRSFIMNNLPDSIIFDPGDVDDFIKKTFNSTDMIIERDHFIRKFSRTALVERLADSILETAKTEKEADLYIIPERTDPGKL